MDDERRTERDHNSSPEPKIDQLASEIKRIGSKIIEKRWINHFLLYKSMEVFCCHGNQRLDPIIPKTLSSLSPDPMMLHMKFVQD